MCSYVYVCMYVCMHVCMYVHMYVCISVDMFICIYAYMYICIYVYMYICIYVCMSVGSCMESRSEFSEDSPSSEFGPRIPKDSNRRSFLALALRPTVLGFMWPEISVKGSL